MKYKVLIVDDDYGMAETVKGIVELIGCETEVAYNGEEALLKTKEKGHPDLIIMDWSMPVLDGWEACRRLKEDKKTCDIPVIMLTARNNPEDEIKGLSVGADDYIAKPFNIDVLTAHIKAALRRNKKEEKMKSGEIVINTDAHTVLVKDKTIELRTKEYDLLCFLMKNKGKAIDRNTLSEHIWGYKHLDTTRAIDETIKCLREKLGSQAKRIETVRGVGYRVTKD